MDAYKFRLGLVDGDDCLHFEFETYYKLMNFIETAFKTSTRKGHVSAVITIEKKEVPSNE